MSTASMPASYFTRINVLIDFFYSFFFFDVDKQFRNLKTYISVPVDLSVETVGSPVGLFLKRKNIRVKTKITKFRKSS